MKKSLRVVLPAALIVSVLGCSHNPQTPTTSLRPQRASLTAADIARSPGTPIEQLLAARVPGITVTRAGDGRIVMLIRGMSTLSSEFEPLFVVDGTPLGNAANFAAVNRNDIESIQVLRDPASTAMYGTQGSGGVILVTTKRF
ncbi:MAG TPA: TonB-dependent receptor plug domain-containing protein [Gemmatimonadales bacterium]|nr:TonB-dependent receptor plug domain-containing protein [Gemmatimonadales bacterium]